jgi:cyclic pyranopterin phosphate synthase
MQLDTWKMIRDRKISKGDVIEVARLAGIMGAKRTGELIPLCHPISLDAISIDFSFSEQGVLGIEAHVRSTGKTGVEMEALVAVSTAALTVYDMCKSVDRKMVIGRICVEEKTGGRSGHFVRSDVEETD